MKMNPKLIRIVCFALWIVVYAPILVLFWDLAKGQNFADFGQFLVNPASNVGTGNPETARYAQAIKEVTSDPAQQVALAERVTLNAVEYANDYDTWGTWEYRPTVREMQALRDTRHWERMHGDCVGRAVFLAELLEAIGRIKYELRTSLWLQHSWVVATVGATSYNLLPADQMMHLNPAPELTALVGLIPAKDMRSMRLMEVLLEARQTPQGLVYCGVGQRLAPTEPRFYRPEWLVVFGCAVIVWLLGMVWIDRKVYRANVRRG